MVNFDLDKCTRSWKTMDGRIDKLGIQVYITMFKLDPAMLELFSFKDDNPLEESPGLRRHSGILMRTIESSLASAEKMERFIPYLKGLGHRHAQYGLQPGYFNVLGKSLLLTIEAELKEVYTPEVKSAWESFWSTMESVLTPSLLEALNTPEKVRVYAAPVRSGSQGRVLGADSVQEKKALPKSNLVLETWKIIEQNCDDHGANVFLHFFRLRPDLLKLFSFKDEEPLKESAGLRRHAGIFIRTLGQALAGLENLTSMLPYIRSLAGRHVDYGITSEMIVTMGEAVFCAVEDGLGPEQWTADVQEAWALAWAAVESAMTHTIDQVRRDRGELPALVEQDPNEVDTPEERPMATLQQDFYQKIGVNAQGYGPAAPPHPMSASDSSIKAPMQSAAAAPATGNEGGGSMAAQSAVGTGPPDLTEGETEEEGDMVQPLEQEGGFERMRSSPPRKQCIKSMPNSLLMVHQDLNGLLPADGPPDTPTGSQAGSQPGSRRGSAGEMKLEVGTMPDAQ
mmetsp:Transcript_72632/g.151685  ORF Transcript_72632/g.151685 Transcript_72632/m.151685 type:complete len:510 (+) Transcript_72632:179-1708(+)